MGGDFTADDVDRLARFLEFGLAGCHHDRADEPFEVWAAACLRIVFEGRDSSAEAENERLRAWLTLIASVTFDGGTRGGAAALALAGHPVPSAV